nr:hypothetical protein [Ferrovum sp.]
MLTTVGMARWAASRYEPSGSPAGGAAEEIGSEAELNGRAVVVPGEASSSRRVWRKKAKAKSPPAQRVTAWVKSNQSFRIGSIIRQVVTGYYFLAAQKNKNTLINMWLYISLTEFSESSEIQGEMLQFDRMTGEQCMCSIVSNHTNYS